jgi:hypothetical protein
MHIRGKLFALGALYDWMYDNLDESLKKRMRHEILELVDYVDSSWNYVSNAVVDGHSRFGNISVLVGLLPIYHDVDEENRDKYYKYLQLVVDNWALKFNPFQEWVNGDGSHSMGWAYGASYSSFYPYIVWEFAADEDSWLTDWQKYKPYFYLYGLRNDYNRDERDQGAYDNFPFSADVWEAVYTSGLQGLQTLFSAYYYQDKYAQWFYNYMKKRNINGWAFKDNCWDILYNNFKDDAGLSPNDLPLSKYFKNSAYTVIRDRWDFNKNTLLVFKSSTFYAANHHHKDQNAFTIYYKGPLAIDAGTYEAPAGGWGSDHFWNYYTRSVAHNTILVYDSTEKFRGYSNDGGQCFFEVDNPSLKQIKEGGCNHLDGIQLYEDNGDYVYTMGDASKAYNPSKLSDFKRHILYLRDYSYNHPVIIIYDNVVSTKPSFKKTYLLHSIREPEVSDSIVKITIDDGMDPKNRAFLFEETILPEKAEMVKVGGRKNNREYFVWDDGTGKPHNYNEEINYENLSKRQKREVREGGEWRVEISPSVFQENDRFLNVISVTDGGEEYSAVKTEYIPSEKFDGLIVNDNDGQESILVLFCKDNVSLNSFVKISKNSKIKQILISGLEKNKNYLIKKNADRLSIAIDEKGNYKSSQQGIIYIKQSVVRK